MKRNRQVDSDLPVEDHFDQAIWDRYLLIGLLSALVPIHSLFNSEFRRIFTALRPDISIPSVSKIRRLLAVEYDSTIQTIRQSIPEQQKVSLALDGWTSSNKLAITSVIMYYISSDWQLKEVQLAFEEVCYSVK